MGKFCDELRKWELDRIKPKVVDAVIEPALARPDQVIGNRRDPLVIAAEVGQQTMMPLPVTPLVVRQGLRNDFLAARVVLEVFV